MASTPAPAGRAGKLQKLFRDVKSGVKKITNVSDAGLFIEAATAQKSPSTCAELLVTSPSGLDGIRSSVRADLSAAFIQSRTLPFLRFISDNSVKTLANGVFLKHLLLAVVQPPTVWHTLTDLLKKHQLEEELLQSFAWLTCELLSMHTELDFDIFVDAEAVMRDGSLTRAGAHEVREIGYKIQKAIDSRKAITSTEDLDSAGGRHDNDFADFKKTAIYPTADEILSTRTPFYRTVNEVFSTKLSERTETHLDNQFRMLREDMLAELRDDLEAAGSKKKGRANATRLGGLMAISLTTGDENRSKRCSLAVSCTSGLEAIQKVHPDHRRKFLKDNRNFLKHQAFGALFCGAEFIAFAFIDRDEDLIIKTPSVVPLQFTDENALGKALLTFKTRSDVCFTLVDTPVFAYEPVLKGLKSLSELPFQNALVDPKSANLDYDTVSGMTTLLVSTLESLSPSDDGSVKLDQSGLRVDRSQRDAIVTALKSTVSIIQGPPGTGKSFVGAQIIKYLQQNPRTKILVISYTNHALDQFIEDLLNVGIREDKIVRLGSKCTLRTAPLLLSKQGKPRRSGDTWGAINLQKKGHQEYTEMLDRAMGSYLSSVSFNEIMETLEFSDDDREFFDAFLVPDDNTGFQQVGRKGRAIQPNFLFERWRQGHRDAGILNRSLPEGTKAIWKIPPNVRHERIAKWMTSIIQERIEAIQHASKQIDGIQESIDELFNQEKAALLQSKQIIACTTTAAAMYNKMIRAAEPDMLMVEEAGEILESHILTALSPTIKQLVLIGDHKQLPPKINNYALSKDKGDGFDLNLSLFERLIIQGVPYTTLRKQHRMHPDISLFPRKLTYPDLLDDPKTHERTIVRGLRSRVVFVNHDQPEDNLNGVTDRRDPTVNTSKQNEFEAAMVLKCVRYLSQQGYKTSEMVVLTPYLGQLRLLLNKLAAENDPVLNELDSYELIRAGLMTQAAAKVQNRPLRLSSIDNYQGEESDIVIASLTRSNKNGDIGFMAAPERLNVLMSRARCGIVLLGNINTFMTSRKGKATWAPFFQLMEEEDNLYDGLPVKCEKHPERISLLATPEDFEINCPDGGCAEPCGAMLSCGKHKCSLRCHRVTDHSKVPCTHPLEITCARKHKLTVECGKQGEGCRECAQEDRETERRLKRDLELEKTRIERQKAYRTELDQIQDEIEHHRRLMKYMREEEENKKTLAQQRANAEALKETSKAMLKQREQKLAQTSMAPKTTAGASPNRTIPADKLDFDVPSDAKDEWEYLKSEGAQNHSIDELIGMIGLEEVKQEFLNVKLKVDTAIRQDTSLASERFSCSLLGNPGTGKTTVARLYAKFLSSVGVIPGSCFKEVTGAALAHGGVSGCQKLIDEILNEGGGVLFIDEAYQMTSGNSMGGGAVLDYLLPEVENLTGKVVFVLAGYNKQMESFFAHNPGLPSRFPIEMKFADYTDTELLQILQLKMNKKYSGKMKCEDGLNGLYCRIVATRIGRGRGQQGFGNARTVENILAQISRRQVVRLSKQRRAKQKPNDFLLTKQDLIGLEPSDALKTSQGWQKLQQLIGLDSVKQAVKALVDTIQQNYVRELAEQPIIEYSLNKVFLGNPGTGKTTIAKLYGSILVDLGLLSKGEVIVKNPSDFVGAALGQSEQQTKGILAAAVGKILVIDEAYGLYGGSSGTDIYKTAVVDTIVAEVQSVPGDDRCVLLLGYKDQMETMMQNVNPGLSRRFPISAGFTFDDFNNDQLRNILDLKLKQQGYQTTGQGKNVVLEMLSRARNRPNFGNAGEIDIILDAAKAHHQTRFSSGNTKDANLLEAVDFDEDFDRAERGDTNIKQLFEGTVGCENIIAQLEGYQETVRTMKSLDLDPKENIPFNFLFRGPPGTGKTTTANKMGKVFYDMGFLAKAEVVECSTTDLIAQYIGQTGPKVQQQLDKALGKVLFIDEAYRLAEGHFAQEAMDEIVDSVTKPQYMKKLVIILAGYEKDINRLMTVNPGLTSRFPDVVDFHSLTPLECMGLLCRRFENQKTMLEEKKNQNLILNITCLQTPSKDFEMFLLQIFSDLQKYDGWASARDVLTVAKTIFGKTIKTLGPVVKGNARQITLTELLVRDELLALLKERESRITALDEGRRVLAQPAAPLPMSDPNSQSVPKVITNVRDEIKPEVSNAEQDEVPIVKKEDEKNHGSPQQPQIIAKRDVGVSDEVWEQLQRDQKAEEGREEAYQQLVKEKDEAVGEARQKILERLLEEERRREEEMALRAKLAQLGVCPMGYNWIRQKQGYRCAGGSHFLGHEQIDRM